MPFEMTEGKYERIIARLDRIEGYLGDIQVALQAVPGRNQLAQLTELHQTQLEAMTIEITELRNAVTLLENS